MHELTAVGAIIVGFSPASCVRMTQVRMTDLDVGQATRRTVPLRAFTDWRS